MQRIPGLSLKGQRFCPSDKFLFSSMLLRGWCIYMLPFDEEDDWEDDDADDEEWEEEEEEEEF